MTDMTKRVWLRAEQQLFDYFASLQSGRDVSPAGRYRLEGYLQALLDAGVLEAAVLRERIEQIAGQYGISEPPLGDAPNCLPYQVPRAPVFPSTKT